MSLWVCSKWNKQPTDAEKWEVVPLRSPTFYETVKELDGFVGYLPVADYRPCEPPALPERWVDVTEKCHAPENTSNGIVLQNGDILWLPSKIHNDGYRLRKIAMNELSCQLHTWAFVIEKKEG